MNTRQIPFGLVAARSINRGIGFNKQIPWKLLSDLKMFKKITTSGSIKKMLSSWAAKYFIPSVKKSNEYFNFPNTIID
jgi:dihydrofolate reductase